MRPRHILIWLLAASAILAVGLGIREVGSWMPPGRSIARTFIGGEVQPEDETLEGWLERRAERMTERTALLELPDGELVETTFGALGIELDVTATAARVRAHASDGSWSDRLARAWMARNGNVDLDLEWHLNVARATEALAGLHGAVDRAPVDARIDLGAHVKVREVPGRRLEVPATVAAIAAGGRDDWSRFPVATNPVPAEVTTAMLIDVDVTRVLSTYETSFAGTGLGREQNIAHAAKFLNGAVIAPDQELSFNTLVGPRTLERGFTWAPEIYDDELIPGVGGGTCQVASTLHAVAVMGGLEIVRRRNHSRPSSYVPLGLDATVIDGDVDLVIRNPYPVPLVLHAVVPERGRLRIEILGTELEGEVKYTYAVLERYPFYRRVTTRPELDSGTVKRRQKGGFGYDVRSTIRIRSRGGEETVRHYRSEYRPTPEVYWVGVGGEASSLPALPAGADRVVVDGQEVAAAPRVPTEGDG
ncbi:MAG: VanW family protein [Polyangiaceae bacterium]|nr:VanW family protein [Polyangiaceae bacterium]